MKNKILYINQDRSVGLMSIADQFTVDDALAFLPVDSKHVVIDDEQISTIEDFEEFFDAIDLDLSDSEPQIIFNIERAKQIVKERLRTERISLFETLDILIRDAMLENNESKLSDLLAERDRLRNITMLVDQVNTLEELKNIKL